nr:PREDICTED: phosphoglycolate phosphatase 2-like isoform X1 [Tribolium castaneum]|eukprot:XP_015834454.1 PREDICTED: phosphoglycolate phosphatase 2-like isoform X1 [Tribolium castaneum]
MKTFKLSKVTTKISIFFILTLLAFSLTMMRDLTTLSDKELEAFFASFDQVLTDVDGVLWNVLETIPGTDLGIKSLKKIGKKVTAVSNNTTKSLKVFQQQFKSAGIDLGMDEIVTPALVMVSYLKSQNFDKEIFLLGMPCLREIFENAGFKVAKNDESVLPIKTLHEFASATSDDNDNIGAVVTDVDLNLNYPNLQKAATLLKRPQVIFLMGAMDVEVPIGLDRTIIGPGCFHKILEQISGRRGLEMAKPSLCLNDFIVKKCGLTDPRKVLFIGDSVPIDMGFATKCNYRKLLVLSGLTKKEQVEDWAFNDELKPDFYVDSLKILHDLIVKIYGKN